MIAVPARRYQLALWTNCDRSGKVLHLQFDSREKAERAFAANQAEGTHCVGIIYEWNKRLHDWTLLDQYPRARE